MDQSVGQGEFWPDSDPKPKASEQKCWMDGMLFMKLKKENARNLSVFR